MSIINSNTNKLDINKMKEYIEEFEEFKKSILKDKRDYVIIDGITYFKHLAFSRIANHFRISTDIIKEEVEILDDKRRTYNFTVKAYRVNLEGTIIQTTINVGSCSSWEKNAGNTFHNIRSKAHTRAKKRAISDLVGGMLPYEEYKEFIEPTNNRNNQVKSKKESRTITL